MKEDGMKRQLLSFVWLMAFITFASEVYAPPQKTVQKSVNLNVGASQNIDLDGEYAVSITLSRSGVAEIERGKNKGELTVTGKKSGTVTAEVLCESNNMVLIDIKVTDSTEVWRILNSIKTALAGIEGLSSMVVGEKVMVMGTLTSETTLRNLETIKKRYPGYVIDTTAKTLPPRSAVVEAINQSLSENGISNIQARNYGKIVLLEGTPKSDSERDLALRIARMMYPEVEDRVRKDASAAHSINIDVIFVEVQKSSHLKYGLNGQFVSSPEKLPVGDKAIGKAVYKGSGDSKGKLSWSVNSLGFFLELLQSNSASRILSNPRGVVRSGE
jgi:hypothetical protein